MDVLTDRTIKSSDYYSRYNGLSYYYNHLDNIVKGTNFGLDEAE